ncbi:hypothetical protein AVO45_18700 [Ruegeria marisrubri]|uniref:HTH marR-type domain-containing protein n=1 Tax=Ruegeria marisrubri TaxID=1685379 RepID=A0A0X3U545_9RHOB|nr:MarR family winged helix-turn-helix transcriptional regulator [Ruegeria marisrubri]KUJ83215.1 hypothetical protein AVO45_18700 [Ruegeria marisrubri]
MNDSEHDTICPWSDLPRDGAELEVHDFITTQLSALMSLLRRKVTLSYANEFDLSVSEWRVLSLIAHANTLPFGELVAQSTSDKALVSRTIRLLEQRDLIQIHPESEHAKKKIACTIRPNGQVLHDKVIVIARKKQADVLRVLSEKERVSLYRAVTKLRSYLEEFEDDDSES